MFWDNDNDNDGKEVTPSDMEVAAACLSATAFYAIVNAEWATWEQKKLRKIAGQFMEPLT
jgi:hypothetical protein